MKKQCNGVACTLITTGYMSNRLSGDMIQFSTIMRCVKQQLLKCTSIAVNDMHVMKPGIVRFRTDGNIMSHARSNPICVDDGMSLTVSLQESNNTKGRIADTVVGILLRRPWLISASNVKVTSRH